MDHSAVIYRKLEDFIRKFYTNELLKGAIFFTGIGLLYFLFTLLVEHFLWLKPSGRTFLFWAFVLVELFLLGRYILFPLGKLFRLQKGIGYDEASQIIGRHFSEVGDKLTNFLQLSRDDNRSELLLASIRQKADTLQPIPFTGAVSYRRNRKYIPLALLPILFVTFFYLSGNGSLIGESFSRVVHYRTSYTPPAPFRYIVMNEQLATEQGSDFVFRVKTEGKMVPEDAMIFIGDESYSMETVEPGVFEYRFTKPSGSELFHVEANNIPSTDYELKVLAVPAISNFEMRVDFPAYLKRPSQTIKGTGNAVVPEGSRITWNVSTVATSAVEWSDGKATQAFSREENRFRFSRTISQQTEYRILTSNEKVRHHERLNYQVSVIKDQFPTISVGQAPDSLKVAKDVLVGMLSDDYGLSALHIFYYPQGQPERAKKGAIPVRKALFDQFVFTFPSNLPVEQGVSYEYYFEVADNDALHGYKKVRSTVFSDRIQTDREKEDQLFQQQNSSMSGLEKSVREQNKQLSELEKLQNQTKQKDNLDFKDQKKVDDFIRRQEQQERLMKEFSEKLKKNLDEFKTDKKDEFKELLKERLEKNEKLSEETQKLLDKLKELNDKIRQEELMEKMDELKQNSKNQTKNLQQLLEMTKRYYVQKKAEQIADKLKDLSEKQEKLSNQDKENTAEKQEEINKEFDKIQQEMKDLQKENESLKSPMDLPKEEQTQKAIDEDMKNASDELKKENKAGAKPKQKSAARKMQQMSGAMMQGMQAGEMEQMEEDVKMLRQILDNLLAYSFSQEALLKDFRNVKRGAPSYNKNLKLQQDLKQQFLHVDDSLFALSLRNPKIGETINEEVGKVHYNVDKSLENLVEGQVGRGVTNQQYATASANKLADMLSDLMNNMQMSMAGMGQGKPSQGQGEGMQLPDIIQKQGKLGEQMQKGMKEGEKPGGQEGQKPGGEKPGMDGKDGKQGGKQGGKQPGSKGQSGQSGQGEGENGQDGEGRAGEIMKIYKEQRQLREALERELQQKGMGGAGQNAVNQMKDLEKQLLNKGFRNETLQKMFNAKQELLKLEKAMLEQGEEKKRQSQTNRKEFRSSATPIDPALQRYLNSIEILNRQTLPLRPNYDRKVQDYFKADDKL